MYVSVPHVCLVPMEVRRAHWVPWYRSTDAWKPSSQCWELVLSPPPVEHLTNFKQWVLLTRKLAGRASD